MLHIKCIQEGPKRNWSVYEIIVQQVFQYLFFGARAYSDYMPAAKQNEASTIPNIFPKGGEREFTP